MTSLNVTVSTAASSSAAAAAAEEEEASVLTTENDTLYVSTWAVEPYNEAIAVPVIFGVIFIVGLIGNGTLMFIVASNKAMRNLPNLLIVSLSLGDLLLILISVPLTSTVYTFSNWPYGTLACKLNHFLQTWSLGVTVFSLTALSVDRYLAITDPLAKHRRKSPWRTVALCLSFWLLAFLLAVPDFVLSTESTRRYHPPPYHITICSNFPDGLVTQQWLVPRIYFVLRFVAFFAVPLVIIAVFYLLMARALVRSGRQMPGEGKVGGVNRQRHVTARRKVARIELGLVLLFLVCWLPRHVYLLWFFFDDSHYNEFWHYFKILGFCLTYLNSYVNPFALYFLSSQFRKHYNTCLLGALRRLLRWSSSSSSASSFSSGGERTSSLPHFNITLWKASPTDTSVLHAQSPFSMWRRLAGTLEQLSPSRRKTHGRYSYYPAPSSRRRGKAILRSQGKNGSAEIELQPQVWPSKSPSPFFFSSSSSPHPPASDRLNRSGSQQSVMICHFTPPKSAKQDRRFHSPLTVRACLYTDYSSPDTSALSASSPLPKLEQRALRYKRRWTVRQDSVITIGEDVLLHRMSFKSAASKKTVERRKSSPP